MVMSGHVHLFYVQLYLRFSSPVWGWWCLKRKGGLETSKQHRKMLVKLIIWWGRLGMCVFFTYNNAQKDRSWCNPIKILITYYLRFYRFVLYLSDVMMLSKFLDASSRESRTSGLQWFTSKSKIPWSLQIHVFSIFRIMMYHPRNMLPGHPCHG